MLKIYQTVTSTTLLIFLAVGLTSCTSHGDMAEMSVAKQAEKLNDFATAQDHYTRIAENGVPEAHLGLAKLLLKQNPHPTKAVGAHILSLAQKAAAEDMPQAYLLLGDLARDGIGGPKNPKQSYDYYVKAYHLGYKKAAYKIGDSLLDSKHPPEALPWFQQAFDAGNPKALTKIGQIWEDGGIGVTKNVIVAQAYYKWAAELAVADGVRNAARLDKKLTADGKKKVEETLKSLKSGLFNTP